MPQVPDSYRPPTDPEQTRAHKEALEQLVRSPGWKLIQLYIAGQRGIQMGSLIRPGSTSDQLHRIAGTLAVLEDLERWPTANIQAYTQQLEKLKGR